MPTTPRSLRRRMAPLGLLTILALGGPAAADPARPPAQADALALFAAHVRPVLEAHCVRCHGGEATKGDFDLTTRAGLLTDNGAGPAVLPGNARESRLFRLVAGTDRPRMPYKEPQLADEIVARIGAWIDAGAPYDATLVAKSVPQGRAVVTDADRQFWSFRPLEHPEPPPVAAAAWCRTPIDRFILQRLEARDLAPNGPADRRTLIRRAAFDLTGLPPTPEEVAAFVADPAPDAYEKLLDRLLDSPHHGERWARHWLDLARFAESHGYEQDYDRKYAYHYRDFVIKALNQDKPYDQFVRWQIAGDELAPEDPLALMATGFLGAGTHATQITASQVEKERYDELDDMVATTGTAMLGLTIGCARCHDHKFDPIPTADYYRVLATFTTTVRSEIDLDLHPERTRTAQAEFGQAHAPLVTALVKFEAEVLPGRLQAWLDAGATGKTLGGEIETIVKTPAERRTDAQRKALSDWYRTTEPEWQALHRAVQEHQKLEPRPEKVMVTSEGFPAIRLHTQGADFFDKTFLLRRGDLKQKMGEATPGFLQVLMRAPEGEKRWQDAPPAGWRTSYRRRALANWITDVDAGAGPLLARVIVNRLWQHHFGRGIVASPSDFGAQGERPTHPELLDWLAAELIRGGWRLKPIHKLLMTSAVYTQDGAYDTARAAVDPENTLQWRRSSRRLEAEAIRDAMLAVSGTLDATMFGPGALDEGQRRRSIYFTIKRSQLIPILVLFDAPDSLQGIGSRPATTIAPQALLMMNNPHVQGYARAFAGRLGPSYAASPAEAVRAGYRIALGRAPAEDELADAIAFLALQAESYRSSGQADTEILALADFC
ncbi:MAG TPA: PSD1 and planctomycete cytochrome C domain-containing protein, partial [Isosphaeraceae bacterium]